MVAEERPPSVTLCTVTNLKLETTQGCLHINVTKDINEILKRRTEGSSEIPIVRWV
jgi:hypothetical protein